MSFNFGKPTTTAATTGFSFGTPSNAFSFGQTSAAQPTTTNTGFAFGGGGGNNTGFGGAIGSTGQPSSMFGAATPATQSTGFSFAPVASTATGGNQVTTAGTGLFGSTPGGNQATTAASGTGLFGQGKSFGGSIGASSSFLASNPASTSGGAFSLPQTSAPAFGSTSTGLSSGFGFGAPTTKPSFQATPSAPLTFGSTTTTAATKSMFSLPTAQPSTSATGFAQPVQTTGLASKPFSLGGVATTVQPVQQTASTGFSLNQQPTKTDGFQLGGSSSGFKLGGLTSSIATTTPAASGFQLGSTAGTGSSFGGGAAAPFLSSALASSTSAQQKPAAATTATAPATKSGFMLGGSASSTTPSSGFQLGGGLKLGTTAAATTAPPVASASPFNLAATSTAPKTAIAPSAGSFGLTSSAATTTAATASSSSSSGFKLGGGLSLGGAAATTSSSLGGGIKLPGATATTTTTTTAAAVATETPSLRYKDLETRINKWTNELEQQEQLFLTQATQVNAWDKLLIDNGEKITNLNSEFEKVKCDQDRLDQEIDFIRTQQQELEDLLLPLEEKTRQQVSSLAGAVHTHHADVERERTYNLAENIDAQLKQMVQDLKEVIEHINATSQPADAADPVNQISKILSAHMDSLQWLDSNSGALQQKLNVLVKEVNTHKVEQESRFRLAFD